MQPGPVVAEAMFVNREEVPIHPIYRDPVHDFGFFRYDPARIKFLSYEELPLCPEAAYVGLEIRVIGNESGEKVSISAGTLARLDRDAPQYKSNGYNDFNTFYLQAASGTKFGSSGSPVIDSLGRAVALNAGCRASGASAYFLPLERVVRALSFLLQKKNASSTGSQAITIPRGTLQTTFVHRGFDETRRLGLQVQTEQIVRQVSPIGETGMLVVDSVVPEGPAHLQLEPGDVLVRVNGEVNTQFLKLETTVDDNVGQTIQLEMERGGSPMTINLEVQDLHAITPDYFLEVSGAVIHPLSYQQARNFRLKCGLVYVAEPGYMFSRALVPRHAIIKKFAGENVKKVEDLVAILQKLSIGDRVPMEYITHLKRHRNKSVLITIDRHEWYAPPQIYHRDDASGLWNASNALCSEPDMLKSIINGDGTQIANDATGSVVQSSSPDEPDNHEEPESKRRCMQHGLTDRNGVLSHLSVEKAEEILEEPLQARARESLHGLSNALAATSIAELIEPALVMLEICNRICFTKSTFSWNVTLHFYPEINLLLGSTY